jgi:hypothetical protein
VVFRVLVNFMMVSLESDWNVVAAARGRVRTVALVVPLAVRLHATRVVRIGEQRRPFGGRRVRDASPSSTNRIHPEEHVE